MDDLQKLFAEASASVKKATRKEPDAPAEVELTPPAPAGAAPTPVVAAPVAAPPPPKPASGPGGTVQVGSGQQTDQGLTMEGQDLAWSALQGLCLGRAGTAQVIGLRHGGTVYLIPQDKVNLKGLVRNAKPDSVGNWRQLVTELAARLPSSDPGIQAITSGGGMIPKYATVEAFIEHVKGS